MKLLFKKIILASILSVAGIAHAQYYPNDNYNNNPYEYYYDDYNYPEDYYYEYPSDYYTRDFYRKYYNDYRNAILSINWDRFYLEFRLNPWQIREIRLLNNRFTNFDFWFSYYRYNPDRWYYDRFIAIERILGPRIYVSFYNRYYHNYNPIVYYRNYRVKHYRPVVYVTPRYRNMDVRTFRNDDFRKGSFRDGFNGKDNVVKDNNSFRRDDKSHDNSGSYRNENQKSQNNDGFRGGNDHSSRGFGKQDTEQPRNNGFRNESSNKSNEINRANDDSRKNNSFRGGENKSSASADKNHNSSGRGFR